MIGSRIVYTWVAMTNVRHSLCLRHRHYRCCWCWCVFLVLHLSPLFVNICSLISKKRDTNPPLDFFLDPINYLTLQKQYVVEKLEEKKKIVRQSLITNVVWLFVTYGPPIHDLQYHIVCDDGDDEIV